MVPSSSGLGHLVLIQKIAGSTPAGITNERSWLVQLFLFVKRRESNGGGKLVTILPSQAIGKIQQNFIHGDSRRDHKIRKCTLVVLFCFSRKIVGCGKL